MRKSRLVATGLVFVLIAVALIASQFTNFDGVRLGFWAVVGTIACALVIIGSVSHLRFGVSFMVPLALLYSLWSPQFGWPIIGIWILLLAAVVAGAGIDMLTHSLRKNRWQKKLEEWDGEAGPFRADYAAHKAAYKARVATWKSEHPDVKSYYDGDWRKGEGSGGLHLESSGDDNHPVSRVHFGSNSRYLHSDALSSGLFDVSFGKLEVFFDQAQMAAEGAKVITNVSFGELRLYVPSNWTVNTQGLSVSFTGTSNHPGGGGQSGPTLTLEGNVSFGNLAIERVAPQQPQQPGPEAVVES